MPQPTGPELAASVTLGGVHRRWVRDPLSWLGAPLSQWERGKGREELLQCDQCGLRFVDADGILTCPDCLVPLRWLGEDPGKDAPEAGWAPGISEEVEVAHTAHDSMEADMIVSNLRAEGIPCGVQVMRSGFDSYARPGPQLFGDGTGPPGSADIVVHRPDLERAREIIRALLEGRLEGFPE